MRRYAEFARFLVGGAVNTAFTYALYLLLLQVVSYLWAYSLSYVAGILLSLFLNARFVFGVRVTLRTFFLFPLVYLVQYLAGVAIVATAVRGFGLPEAYAPIVAVVLTIPVTFLMSRYVLRPARREAGVAAGANTDA